MKKKFYFYFALFLFFFLLCFLTPISNDDWENFLHLGKDSIICAKLFYINWEGRIISRIIIILLTYRKWLWNIISSIINVSIIYLFLKNINPKNKKAIAILLFLIILCTSFKTFTQCFIWVTGNITYVFVIPLLLLYFYFIANNKVDTKLKIYLFAFLNFIMTMFIEQTALLLVISNIILLIYKFKKNGKVDKTILIFLLCSIFGSILMLISPGSQKRYITHHGEYRNLSLLDKIAYNVPNFFKYTYIIHYSLLILLTITNYLLIRKHNTKNRYILYLIMLIIPLFTSFGFILNYFNNNVSFFINEKSKLLCSYYFIYTLLTFKLFLKEKNDKALFFYIIGLFSNLIMILSPTCGNRTALVTYLFLSVSCLIIIDDNIIIKKSINILLSFLTAIIVTFYMIFYIGAYKLHNDHIDAIKECNKNKCDILYLQEYPESLRFLLPIEKGKTKEGYYKQIYHIKENVKIVYTKNKWKYNIFYSK